MYYYLKILKIVIFMHLFRENKANIIWKDDRVLDCQSVISFCLPSNLQIFRPKLWKWYFTLTWSFVYVCMYVCILMHIQYQHMYIYICIYALVHITIEMHILVFAVHKIFMVLFCSQCCNLYWMNHQFFLGIGLRLIWKVKM